MTVAVWLLIHRHIPPSARATASALLGVSSPHDLPVVSQAYTSGTQPVATEEMTVEVTLTVSLSNSRSVINQ